VDDVLEVEIKTLSSLWCLVKKIVSLFFVTGFMHGSILYGISQKNAFADQPIPTSYIPMFYN